MRIVCLREYTFAYFCHVKSNIESKGVVILVLCSMLNGSRFEYAVLSLDDLKSPLFVRLCTVVL